MFSAEGLIGLFTLVLLEIILGIDNIIFIAILCSFIQTKKQQHKARTIGLTLALLMRVVLLFAISWIVHLTETLFSISSFDVRGRDLILFAGGVFLIYKTIKEIYFKLRGHDANHQPIERILMVQQAILQIALIDMVFSFDSILTAVGLSNDLAIMITAVVISMIVMLIFASYVSDFINKYPTIKMLALVFLVVIGIMLLLDSLHLSIPKGYIYVGLGFSLIVEMLNIRFRNIQHKAL